MTRLTRLFLGIACVAFASAAPLNAQNFCAATAGQTLGPSVGQWQRWEQALISTNDYVGTSNVGNPYRDLLIRVTFTNCSSGARVQSYGFWYGLERNASGNLVENRKAFRLRAALPAGTWQWVTSCSKSSSATASVQDCADTHETGLAQKGRFQVTTTAVNALYRQGFLNRSDNGRFLTYGRTAAGAEGIPFFWIGDAAWNAPILASQAAWQTYIDNRASNTSAGRPNTAFTVVHVAIAPKVAGLADTGGNAPFDAPDSNCSPDAKPPNKCSRWNARFWAGLDDKIQYANQKGLVILIAGLIEPLQKELDTPSFTDSVAAPVIDSPGLETYARNVAARYSGNFVVLSPGFDHRVPDNLALINKTGLTIGDDTISRNFVTNHPAGASPLADLQLLQSKSWLDFQMFQSGTPGTTASQELLNATERARALPLSLMAVSKPVINGEAIYEGTVGATAINHTPYRARQTAWLSFLSGAMGYSAGTCGIFDWGKGTGGCSPNVSFSESMGRLTSRSMRHLRYILQSVYWPKLRPEHGRIKNQAPTADQKMALAYDGSSAILAYVTAEQESIQIDFRANAGQGTRDVLKLSTANSISDFLASGWAYRWFSPRTGSTFTPSSALLQFVSKGVFRLIKPGLAACDHELQDACDRNDWVLRLTYGIITPPPTGLASSHLEVSNDTSVEFDGSRIVAQLIDDATGQTLEKLETGEQGTSTLGPPRAAYEPGGNGLVVWQSQGEESTSIMGRVLDSQGNPITEELVISGGSGVAGHPDVASLPTGHFVVAWASDKTGEGILIRYQVFDRKGSALGPEQTVMSCESVPGDFPRVTAMASGGFAIAWEGAGGKGIHVVQFDSVGSLLGTGWAARESAGWPVLESLDGTGLTPAVGWGGYGFDGEAPIVDGGTEQVSIEQCP